MELMYQVDFVTISVTLKKYHLIVLLLIWSNREFYKSEVTRNIFCMFKDFFLKISAG